MLQAIRNKKKKLGIFYKRFIRANAKRKQYKKIAGLFAGLIKQLFLKKPYVLVVETGTVCNINCPTCPTPREIIVDSRAEKNMDFDTFKKIINNARVSFPAVLLYWSNEPLLNKDIVKMVRYCNELNLYTFISTNVTLLSGDKFKELIDAGLDELLVCVDGFSAGTFEPFRKGAKFETVKYYIETACALKKELRALNPWIEIQYVENRYNTEEITLCKKWAEKAGVDGFRVQSLYISKHLKGYEKLRDEFYTERNWEEANKKDSGYDKKICRSPELTVCVLVNGQLTVCCNDIKGVCSYGNLLEHSFKAIAKNEKYLEIKRKGRKRALGICKGC